MSRFSILIALILALSLWQPAVGQVEDAEAESGLEEPEQVAEEEEPEIDDSDLDEQTYEEDDDDFIPTEEIPADEPIPFPTNI